MSPALDDNQVKVLNEFRLLGQASKADVARRVELSHPAVATIVNRLCKEGYLDQNEEKRRGQRGQPATLYRLSDHNLFVGIHVGRERLEFVGLTLTGKLVASAHFDIGFLQRANLIQQCQPEFDRFLSHPQIGKHYIVGYGISTPYFWQGWQSILPLDCSDDDWNWPQVTQLFRFPDEAKAIVENDGSSAALAELTFGSGVGHRDFLYVYISTLIGGGLVIDGTVRTGTHGNSAAVGPFPVSPATLNGSPRSSRPFEDLLSRASLHALREHAARAGVEIDLLAWNEAGTPEDAEYLQEWIDDCSAALAQFFIGVWSLIDIESIILDGALPRELLQRIIDAIGDRLGEYEIEGIIPSDIKLGQLGPMAQSVGAACLPVLRYFGPPPIDPAPRDAG